MGDTSSQIEESKRTTNTFYTDLIEDPTPFGHESLRNQALVRLLGLPDEAMPPLFLSFDEDAASTLPLEFCTACGLPIFSFGGERYGKAMPAWPAF